MAISLDATSGGSVFSTSWSHTVGSGTTRALIVGAFDDTGGSNLLTAVTWNTSESFTKIGEILTPSDRWLSLWYLLTPTSGTHTIALTTTAGAMKGSAISIQATGALSLDVSSTNSNGGGSSVATTMTLAANAWIISTLKENSGTTVTWTNATEDSTGTANGLHMAYGGPFTGSTTTTGSYTGGLNAAIVTASFKEASTSASAQVLVVAGGASGGKSVTAAGRGAGGGGAGGMRYNAALSIPITPYTVTVGTAGAAQSTNQSQGNDGTASSFAALLVTVGGGGGGSGNENVSAPETNGRTGGSGGGAGQLFDGTLGTVGAGTSGEGSNGGAAVALAGGGGGGNTAAGSAGSVSTGGAGGTGTSNSISASAVTYSTGGGGGNAASVGTSTTNPGDGGAGGGGDGSNSLAGQNGIVIIRYHTADFGTCTGGNITTSGGDTIHTFLISGTWTPTAPGGATSALSRMMRMGIA